MTAASTGRRERRLARKGDGGRALTLLHAAATVAALAEADATVTGGTIMMPSGETRFFSLADAKAMLGQGPAAGSA